MKNWKTLHIAIEQDGSTSDSFVLLLLFFLMGNRREEFSVERNILCCTEVITGDWKEGTMQRMEKLS